MTKRGIATLALVAFATTGFVRPAAAGDLKPGAPGFPGIVMAPRPTLAPKSDDRSDERWYGGPALVADALTLTLLAGAGALKSPSLAYLAIGTYMLGGPLSHGLHGHAERAIGSFFLRAATVASVSAGIYVATARADSDWAIRNYRYGLAPALLVVGAALFITTTVLDGRASDTTSVETPRSPPRPALTPSVFVGQSSSLVGQAGTF